MTQSKILFINNTSKMGAGTSQSLILLLRYLKDRHQVCVVSDRHSKELPEALQELGINHFGFRDRTIFFLPQLIFYILRNRIDLVYGNNLSGRSRITFYVAKITGRPFIWHIRESVRENDPRAKEVHLADAIIANSNDTAERLVKFAKVKDPVVIPNGVEFKDFKMDRESCRRKICDELHCEDNSVFVINSGTVCDRKNQLDVIRVGNKMLSTYPDVHLIFLGRETDSDYIGKMHRELDLSPYKNNFHFLGFKKDFIPYLVGSDILLHTAKKEPQGRVIIEAMAAKLPVIAYDVGGVGEAVVKGDTGFLRKFGDTEGMTADLRLLLENPLFRSELGVNGFRRAKTLYSSEKTALKVITLIDQTLSKNRGGN